MIEIIVDGKTAREKLFDTYSSYQITPKNDEIRKYCVFLEKYYANHDKETNHIDDFFIIEIDNKKYKKIDNDFIIRDDENFLFKFPDEETAFYFKLKYC